MANRAKRADRGLDYGRFFGKKRLVKRGDALEYSQLEKHTANEVIEVECGKECIAARHLAIVGGQITDFSDPMDCFHQFRIGYKIGEYISSCELKERCSFAGLDAFHFIYGLDNPFKSLACIYGGGIGFGVLPLFAQVAKMMQRSEFGYLFKVVEIKHNGEFLIKPIVHAAVEESLQVRYSLLYCFLLCVYSLDE